MRLLGTSRKGQALTYDFFIAMGVFFVVLSIVFGYWYFSTTQVTDIDEKNRASGLLFAASDVWFKEGFPYAWNTTNVIEIGLSSNGVINNTKVNQLSGVGYPKLTQLLNLGVMNVRYTLYNQTNQVLYRFPSGALPGLNSSSNIYSIDRVGILNDSAVRINTVLWE
jgi:hypothetical protein